MEAARALPYDRVLMDMIMPEMDGLITTRAIGERAGAWGVPVIGLTANPPRSPTLASHSFAFGT
jgi:CheY-like chemotaxis protein